MLLFTEKYSPKTYNNFILPPRITDQFKNGLYGHALFHGNPGIGKSSLAKFLCKDLAYLYVNASEDGRIDVLRGVITQFCTEIQVNLKGDRSEYKVVILDEIDGVSSTFFDALRGFMDSYKNVRFIATCNNFHKIPDPIKSRFECVNFDFESSEEAQLVEKRYRSLINAVAKNEKMIASPEMIGAISEIYFPDFRKPLQLLQRLSNSGVTTIEISHITNSNFEFKEVYEMIINYNGEAEKLHSYLYTEFQNRPQDLLLSLGDNFVEYIKKNYQALAPAISYIIKEVARDQADFGRTIDGTMTMKASVIKLGEYFKSIRK